MKMLPPEMMIRIVNGDKGAQMMMTDDRDDDDGNDVKGEGRGDEYDIDDDYDGSGPPSAADPVHHYVNAVNDDHVRNWCPV